MIDKKLIVYKKVIDYRATLQNMGYKLSYNMNGIWSAKKGNEFHQANYLESIFNRILELSK